MAAEPLGERLRLLAVTPDDPSLRIGLPRFCGRLLRAGVSGIIHREKSLDDLAFSEVAGGLHGVCREAGALFILNERIGLVSTLVPDAVQLGWRSPGIQEARRSLPASVAIGVSVHSVAEGCGRAADGADFLVFGPIHDTPSKRGLVAVQGLGALRELAASVRIPVVAIGGMTPERAGAAKRAGAAGIAAIGAFFSTTEPEAVAARFVATWSR